MFAREVTRLLPSVTVAITMVLGTSACRCGDRPAPDRTSPSATLTPPPGGDPPPRSSSFIPTPARAELAPLGVGQWTLHRITREDGTRSEMRYQVVAEERGGHWIEVVSGEPGAGTVIQILVQLGDRSDADSARILGARVRAPGGQVREIRDQALAASADAYKKSLNQIFVPDLSSLPRATVSVPAGTFQGAFLRKQSQSFAGIEQASRVWTHPDVPITGLVKSQSLDGTHTTELVDYGMTGAKSSL